MSADNKNKKATETVETRGGLHPGQTIEQLNKARLDRIQEKKEKYLSYVNKTAGNEPPPPPLPEPEVITIPDEDLTEALSKKRFLQVEEVLPRTEDWTAIFNKNPLYKYRWCNGNEMHNGTRGIWHRLDKTHEDFRKLRVNADHTPDKSYISYNEMVLCVSRRETVDRADAEHMEFTRLQTVGNIDAIREAGNRLAGESSARFTKPVFRQTVRDEHFEDDNFEDANTAMEMPTNP